MKLYATLDFTIWHALPILPLLNYFFVSPKLAQAFDVPLLDVVMTQLADQLCLNACLELL